MPKFIKRILKFITILFVTISLIIAAGVSGFLFTIWPTGFPDQELNITQTKIDKLIKIRNEDKFFVDRSTFYPGARNEIERRKLEFILNKVLDNLIANLEERPKKSYVLSQFKPALKVIELYDSEDKDMFGVYLNRMMEVLEIQSSNELLNVWRYGLPLGWFLK